VVLKYYLCITVVQKHSFLL